MKLLLWMAALAASAVLCRAEDVRACPPWQVAVVDENGKPLAGCTVLQEWNCKFNERFVTRSTNALTGPDGSAMLPERWLPAPTNYTKFAKVLNKLSVPLPPDPAANLFVWKRGYEPVRVFSQRDSNVLLTRDGFQSKVVLRPEKTARIADAGN